MRPDEDDPGPDPTEEVEGGDPGLDEPLVEEPLPAEGTEEAPEPGAEASEAEAVEPSMEDASTEEPPLENVAFEHAFEHAEEPAFDEDALEARTHEDSVIDDETWARPTLDYEVAEHEAEPQAENPDLPEQEHAFVDADPNALDAAAGITEPVDVEEEARKAEAARRHLRGLLESLLFVADRAMKTADLCEIARAEQKDVRSILEELSEQYRAEGRGFQLDELAAGWQMRTSAAFAPFVRELTQAKPVRLSRAQVETLAIIAYRQPITRPEIEDIRGVDAGAVLKLLLDRDMVRILGKKDEPGRPLLYGTTSHFLGFFGLKSLKDLPTLREFTELTEESREVVERELGEVLPEGPREPAVPESAAAPSPEERPGPAGEPAMHHAPEEVHGDEETAPEEVEAEASPDEGAFEDEPANDAAPASSRDDEQEDEAEEPATPTEEQETPGGSSYDPSDEELFPDDDDEDFDDDDEDDEDDEEDEDDEDEDE